MPWQTQMVALLVDLVECCRVLLSLIHIVAVLLRSGLVWPDS